MRHRDDGSVRCREIGCRQAEAALSATERLAAIISADGAIGAFVDFLDAESVLRAATARAKRRDASRPIGALDGEMVAVKANMAVAGLPHTACVGAWRDRVATSDAAVVARLKAAGAVLVGTLAMDEAAFGATCDNLRFGRCQNPLAFGFTPGGSSGGSAAAVAAGFVRVALGTDTLGSVRIPAAYCGVLGLKPTAGLLPTSGIVPLATGFDTVGVLAATTNDVAAATDVLAGRHPADPRSRAAPAGWSAHPIAVPGLRIGVPSLPDVDLEPTLIAAVQAAGAALKSQGLAVEPIVIPGWDPCRTRRAALLLVEVEAAAALAELIEAPTGVSDGLRRALIFGRDAAPERVSAAKQTVSAVARATSAALRTCDALLMPTAPQRSFRHGTAPPANQADLTVLANITGLPAVSVPILAEDGGLPAAVQIVGRPFGEAKILGLADRLAGLYPAPAV